VRFVLLILLLCAPALCAAASAAELPVALRGVRTIVTLGDSITEGGGQPGGYVWLVQRWLSALYPSARIRVVNAGVSGHRATDMADRFERDVLRHEPDLVTIHVGVNDVWHAFHDWTDNSDHPAGDLPNGVPLPVYRARVDGMVAAAQKAGARVVLLSPTIVYERLGSPENVRLAGYVRAMREIAERRKCLFIDLNAAFREVIAVYQRRAGTGGLLLTTDGVHMNPAGNRLMAQTLLRGLGVSAADLDRVDD